MFVTITKPDGLVYQGEVQLVQLPGVGGLFEIMDHHAPIVSALNKGNIRIVVNDSDTQNFNVRGGVIQFQHPKLEILAQ